MAETTCRSGNRPNTRIPLVALYVRATAAEFGLDAVRTKFYPQIEARVRIRIITCVTSPVNPSVLRMKQKNNRKYFPETCNAPRRFRWRNFSTFLTKCISRVWLHKQTTSKYFKAALAAILDLPRNGLKTRSLISKVSAGRTCCCPRTTGWVASLKCNRWTEHGGYKGMEKITHREASHTETITSYS